MSSRNRLAGQIPSPAVALVALTFLAAECRGKSAQATHTPTDSSLTNALGALGKPKAPTPPKVPAGNQPCQSLSGADRSALGMPGTTVGAPDRAPATLPFDNVCTSLDGGSQVSQVGFMTKADYNMNSHDNRSTTRQAPGDLPGAFYDQQGGVWISKNGYYVVVSGRGALREPVARVIAGKL